MNPETIELLKWVIGLPAAIIALVTVPFVIRRHQLELRKLRLEIQQLKGETGEEIDVLKNKERKLWLQSFMEWLAPYWIPLACVQWFTLIGVSLWKWNNEYFVVGMGLFLLMLIVGGIIAEFYGPFDLKKRKK